MKGVPSLADDLRKQDVEEKVSKGGARSGATEIQLPWCRSCMDRIDTGKNYKDKL